MDWTDEDRKWIQKMNDLLDMMLGPDHFEFEHTPDTKYCIVAPHTQPSFEYNHQKWEEQFTLAVSR